MPKPSKGSDFVVPKSKLKGSKLSKLLELSGEQTKILNDIKYSLVRLDSLIQTSFNPVPLLSGELLSSEDLEILSNYDPDNNSDQYILNNKPKIFNTLLSKKQSKGLQTEIKYLELERIIDGTRLIYNNQNSLNSIQKLFLAKKLKDLMVDVLG